MRRKKIKIVYAKLGRQKVWGLSHGEFIEIDERLKGRKRMEIIIHEMVHELFPLEHEKDVERKAAIMARTLWKEEYRKIDSHDKDKLQDES